MTTDVLDVIVVGAGVVGSFAGYYCAKAGCKTLVIEQFNLPHSRGSSHGQSRITRMTYDTPVFIEMMKESRNLWKELELESGVKIFKKTGYLTIGSKDDDYIRNCEIAMQSQHQPVFKLSWDDLSKKYPMLAYPTTYIGLLDPSGGILHADKVLRTIQKLIIEQGGHIQDGEPVIEIEPGEVIAVHTTKSVYKTKNLILTPGAWAKKMLKMLNLDLPFTPIKSNVYYFKSSPPDAYSSTHFPVFYDDAGFLLRESGIYGIPSDEYTGLVKVCLADGPVIADPDSRDSVCDDSYVQRICDYVRKHFPNLEPVPSIRETCIITRTPDDNFYLGCHNRWRNVVIGAGMSGHGFKLAPILGKILYELANNVQTTYDLSAFRLDRFQKVSRL